MASREREFLLGRRCRAALHGRDRRRCFRRSFDGLDLCVLCTRASSSYRCDLRVVGGDHTRTRLVVSTRKRARNETGHHRDVNDDDDRIAAPAPHRHAQKKKSERRARRERDDDGLLSCLTSQHPIISSRKTYRDKSHLLRLLRGHNDAVRRRRRRRRLRGNSRRHHFVFFFFFFFFF